MPHTRRQDQSVDAFSLPKDLLAQAKKRARELHMTKSGFYRYCLAKFLGYSEADCRKFAEHRAVLNSVEASITSELATYPDTTGSHHYVMNEEKSKLKTGEKPNSGGTHPHPLTTETLDKALSKKKASPTQ